MMTERETETSTLYTNDAYERIADFLSNYVEDSSQKDHRVPQNCDRFKLVIRYLLVHDVFHSKEDMKRECLRNYSIIIPDFLFPPGCD